MRLTQLVALSSIAFTLSVPALAAHRTIHRGISSFHKLTAKHAAAKPKFQSQRSMDDDRAAQIQSALIRAGYLSGSPTGRWDSESEAAMQKLQGDNGWQTKIVPDSRALIKLGLGPAAPAAPSNVPTSSLAPIASSRLVAQSNY